MSLNEQKQPLLLLLQKAMELELATIPPYLTAILSIRKEKNRVSADLIRSVMMEEMLHMALIANVVSSLGGTISLGPNNIPQYPLRMEFQGHAFRDRAFIINLAPFSLETIKIFLQIEMPASLLPPDFLQAQPEIIIPDITIGAFYQQIIASLEALCLDYPESEIFCGMPGRQIGEQYYWGGNGKPIIVKDLDSARKALNVIIEQGEGAGTEVFEERAGYFSDEEVAHYFRFNEIVEGRHYRPDDLPSQPPTGERFEVDYTAVFPIILNPKHTDYASGSRLSKLNRSFNVQYSLMLIQLEQAFNGRPEVLYDAIINAMHNLTPTAREMMTIPIDMNPDAKHGAPSFEWIDLPLP